jgi:hypothetical protein
MKDYPSDPMPFYAQGFSLVEYLLENGRQFDTQEHCRLVRFAQSTIRGDDWQSALKEHYTIQNLDDLHTSWLAWVGNDVRTLPVVSVSAAPSPAYGKSVYDHREESIPTSFGRDVILR